MAKQLPSIPPYSSAPPRSCFPHLEIGCLRPQHLKAGGMAHSEPGPSAGCGGKGEMGGGLPNLPLLPGAQPISGHRGTDGAPSLNSCRHRPCLLLAQRWGGLEAHEGDDQLRFWGAPHTRIKIKPTRPQLLPGTWAEGKAAREGVQGGADPCKCLGVGGWALLRDTLGEVKGVLFLTLCPHTPYPGGGAGQQTLVGEEGHPPVPLEKYTAPQS